MALSLFQKIRLGSLLGGGTGKSAASRATTGKAVSSSADGMVEVDIGGTTVTVQTVGKVAQGDTVTLIGGSTDPTAVGSAGWGDSVSASVDDANERIDGTMTGETVSYAEGDSPTVMPSGTAYVSGTSLAVCGYTVDDDGIDVPAAEIGSDGSWTPSIGAAWTDEPPKWVNGETRKKYLWTRTIATKADGSTIAQYICADAAAGIVQEVRDACGAGTTLAQTVNGLTLDIETAQDTAEASAKTATNHFEVTSAGCAVGRKSNGSWVGTHALMGADGFSVVDEDGNTLSEQDGDGFHVWIPNSSSTTTKAIDMVMMQGGTTIIPCIKSYTSAGVCSVGFWRKAYESEVGENGTLILQSSYNQLDEVEAILITFLSGGVLTSQMFKMPVEAYGSAFIKESSFAISNTAFKCNASTAWKYVYNATVSISQSRFAITPSFNKTFNDGTVAPTGSDETYIVGVMFMISGGRWSS